MIHIDTHILVWLWERKAKHAKEIGRFTDAPIDVVAGLSETMGLTVSQSPFADVVQRSLTLSWTRDPFDRLIVANAMTDGARLLTFDDRIHKHFKNALWD